jgi:hypothetical protein
MFRLPTVGKGGLFLAVGATLMPLFWDKVGIVARMSWIAMLFLLLAVEYRAIDKDRADFAKDEARRRQEENQKFADIGTSITTNVQKLLNTSDKQFRETTQQASRQFDVTMSRSEKIIGGIKETVNAATGGDGFCYAILIPPGYAGNAAMFSTVIPQGKYPLTNVNLLVTDDDMIVQSMDEVSKRGTPDTGEEFANTMQRAQEWLHIGDLPPHFTEQFSLGRAATVTGDRRMLTINFWANNGSWTEKFALRRVNGKWLRLVRVWRERLDKKKNAFVADVIFNQVDDGFPEDTNTKDPHGVSTSGGRK